MLCWRRVVHSLVRSKAVHFYSIVVSEVQYSQLVVSLSRSTQLPRSLLWVCCCVLLSNDLRVCSFLFASMAPKKFTVVSVAACVLALALVVSGNKDERPLTPYEGAPIHKRGTPAESENVPRRPGDTGDADPELVYYGTGGYRYCSGTYCGYLTYQPTCCGTTCCSAGYYYCNTYNQCVTSYFYYNNYYNVFTSIDDDNSAYWYCDGYSCSYYESGVKPTGCCGTDCCYGDDNCCIDGFCGYCTDISSAVKTAVSVIVGVIVGICLFCCLVGFAIWYCVYRAATAKSGAGTGGVVVTPGVGGPTQSPMAPPPPAMEMSYVGQPGAYGSPPPQQPVYYTGAAPPPPAAYAQPGAVYGAAPPPPAAYGQTGAVYGAGPLPPAAYGQPSAPAYGSAPPPPAAYGQAAVPAAYGSAPPPPAAVYGQADAMPR
jgi:hypothetical protein